MRRQHLVDGGEPARPCASHAGVAKWFGAAPKGATARCKDGEYWTSDVKQGACSGHGGVAMRMKTHKA